MARPTRVFGSILAELTAAVREGETQWMVFSCAGIYFIASLVLRKRMTGTGRTGTRWNESLSEELWLIGLLALAAVAYR